MVTMPRFKSICVGSQPNTDVAISEKPAMSISLHCCSDKEDLNLPTYRHNPIAVLENATSCRTRRATL
ncbi:hypothetical protein KIN20_000520 [Parelaphostrongylus tenuis]|uniref:Uncharacterized protein n=1 Tax=Parelaphostrongylus tenuis TaxID=148309 RepID=A0AAD5MBH9_PARTN|nr:hypothetical protein KIN20_000520 [Parelaphostrongylus tenuis]